MTETLIQIAEGGEGQQLLKQIAHHIDIDALIDGRTDREQFGRHICGSADDACPRCNHRRHRGCAMPKSINFVFPLRVNMMLCGLMSRCSTAGFAPWAYSRA